MGIVLLGSLEMMPQLPFCTNNSSVHRIVDLPLCGSRTLSQVQAERVQGAEGQSRYVRPVGSGTLGAGALGPRFQTALLPHTSRPDYTAVRHRRTRERLYLSNLYLTI